MLLNQEVPLSAQVTKVEMHCIDTNVKKTDLNQNLKDETVPELGPQGPNCQQKNSTGDIIKLILMCYTQLYYFGTVRWAMIIYKNPTSSMSPLSLLPWSDKGPKY